MQLQGKMYVAIYYCTLMNIYPYGKGDEVVAQQDISEVTLKLASYQLGMILKGGLNILSMTIKLYQDIFRFSVTYYGNKFLITPLTISPLSY